MKHAFSFPLHIRNAVREYVQAAIDKTDPARFRQEPAYTAALLAHLHGTVYEGADGSIVFRTTNVDSIGRGAAEGWSGADLAITAEISNPDMKVAKAILAQAKLGLIEEMPGRERERLVAQVRDMRRITRSPKVLLIRELDGRREPLMASGTRIAEHKETQLLSLPDYFVRRLLTTLDGDTDGEFVAAVQESSLRRLHVQARVQ